MNTVNTPLSNMYQTYVWHKDMVFYSSEAAFQAAKTVDQAQRRTIANTFDPYATKTLGKRVELVDGWNDLRIDVMREVLLSKFKDVVLWDYLQSTGEVHLIEDNTWHDHFWGVCKGTGKNHLGKLLMEVRDIAPEPVRLPQRTQYWRKDQVKADLATCFIGVGSSRSSTNAYRKAFGDLANKGEYSSTDRVFVSAEGNRVGRMSIPSEELYKAIDAHAVFLSDNTVNRSTQFNVGEREVAMLLTEAGYQQLPYPHFTLWQK